MPMPRLAKPDRIELLEPTISASLDPHLQQEVDERERVAKAEFLERIIKLSGLFTRHLVFREHHLLDHLATRDLFLSLSKDESALREFMAYLTSPGKDSLGLGPIVLCSEPLSESDPFVPFPLEQVLRRRLGVDEQGDAPWEMSSIYDLSSLQAANAAIHAATGQSRLEEAYKHLGLVGSYERYLDIVSRIWDAHADTTRIPRGRGDFAARVLQNFRELSNSGDDTQAELAKSLVSMIKDGKIHLFGQDERPLIRSTVNPWLRAQPGGYDLQWLVNWSDFEAFVLDFPARTGWASSDDPKMLGYWKGADSNSESLPKRQVGDAIVEIAKIDTGGPIVLDELTFGDLATLRNSQNHQDSLDRVQKEWQCHSLYELQRALCDHVDLIYRELGLKDRSSRKRKGGPSAVVEITLAGFGGIAGFSAMSLLAPGSLGFRLAAAALPPVWVTIKNLWTWHSHKRATKHQLGQLARRVAEFARRDESR